MKKDEVVDNSKPVIIVSVDTNNPSQASLRYACYKARITGFKLKILSVMEDSHKNLLFGAKIIGNEKRQEAEKNIRKLVNTVCKEYNIEPIVVLREGGIAAEIIREIKHTQNCDMIILSKSNNSQSDNTVLPKIMQKIGNKINVPLLLVPQDLPQEYLDRLK